MAKQQLSGIQIPTLSKLNIDGEITLDAQSGTLGHILVSQGSGNTPAWSNTLTSPTLVTSLLTSSTSFDLLTTTATTINFGSVATTFDIGYTGTGASTTNISTGVVNYATKTINLGTGGTGTSTTNINIGATGTTTINGNLTSPVPTLPSTAQQLFFASPTSGSGTPAFRYISTSDFTQSASPTVGQSLIAAPVTGGWSWSGPHLGLAGGTLTGALTLRAGTATASTAPLYLTAGTNLTTPVYGAVEAATDAVYITNNPGSTSTGPGRGVVLPKQMVLSRANATTSNPAPGTYTVNIFAAGNDVLSVLEAAKTYRFRAKYYLSTAFSSGTYSVTTPLTFSNAPALLKYSFKTYPETPGSTITRLGAGTSTAIAPLAGSAAASVTTVVEIDGYFNSHATLTSTLTPQLTCQIISGSTTSTISAGSWFEIEKLGTSTDTLIAGNWA